MRMTFSLRSACTTVMESTRTTLMRRRMSVGDPEMFDCGEQDYTGAIFRKSTPDATGKLSYQ
ncbi:MAG: hypothetical protein M2R45_01907 [Verrucomicrobia subdivision 3 bacterium]|nr:hypothetical protein [Limisphaerales bacterium]MCS1415705.1 hypothetical protein [Limisphaerales bacterium]